MNNLCLRAYPFSQAVQPIGSTAVEASFGMGIEKASKGCVRQVALGISANNPPHWHQGTVDLLIVIFP